MRNMHGLVASLLFACALLVLLACGGCVRSPRPEPGPPLPPLQCELSSEFPTGETPTKQEIVYAMSKAREYAHRCAKETGYGERFLFVDVTFVGETGRIVELGIGAPRRMRKCLAPVFDGVCVHPFAAARFKVKFPYKTAD